MTRRRAAGAASLMALAVVLTLLNAAKPLTADDVSYWLHARQMAAHPSDPYGGRMIWDGIEMPTIDNVAPPVLPAWAAVAMTLLGDDPFGVKVGLLPIAAMLAVAVWALLRRFAPTRALALTWAVLLSPGVLPGFNLMLDVPALALIAASVALLITATDRSSPSIAIAAGLTGALAMQTKWTGATVPVAMMADALVHRRPRFGVLAASIAVGGFLLVEALVAWRYGTPQLLTGLAQRGADTHVVRWWYLLWDLPALVGGTAPILAPLALLALGAGRPLAMLAAAGLLGSFAWVPVPKRGGFWLHALAFGASGVVALATPLLVAARGARRHAALDRDTAFLLLWLAVEIVFYLVLSPFAAARRVLGISVVVLLLVARSLPSGRWHAFGLMVAASIAAGVGVWAVDRHDALSARDAVGQAAERIDQADDHGGRRWALGSWGFHFYAERAGFVPVAADTAVLHGGDWLAVSESSAANSWVRVDPEALQPVARWTSGTEWPVYTLITYYAGWSPLDRGDGRTRVALYRVVRETTARRR